MGTFLSHLPLGNNNKDATIRGVNSFNGSDFGILLATQAEVGDTTDWLQKGEIPKTTFIHLYFC